MIGDWPVSGSRIDSKTYSDMEDIFTIEKAFEKEEAGWSPVRSVNQFVIAEGERLGVKTYIVVPPLICTLPSLSPSLSPLPPFSPPQFKPQEKNKIGADANVITSKSAPEPAPSPAASAKCTCWSKQP